MAQQAWFLPPRLCCRKWEPSSRRRRGRRHSAARSSRSSRARPSRTRMYSFCSSVGGTVSRCPPHCDAGTDSCKGGEGGGGGGSWAQVNTVPSHPLHLLVTVRAHSRVLVVYIAINVRTVIKRTIPAFDRTTSSLVHEVPIKTSKGAMLVALMLEECLTLLSPEFLQVTVTEQQSGLVPSQHSSLYNAFPARFSIPPSPFS